MTAIDQARNNHSGSARPSSRQDDSPTEAILPQLAPIGPVKVAQLMERMSESGMHIGLRSAAFGSIDVHTVVRDSKVGVSIGSERGDLHSLAAPDIPSLQASFRQQDLKLETIQFIDQGSALYEGVSPGTQQDGREFRHSHRTQTSDYQPGQFAEVPSGETMFTPERTTLSVHA